MASESDVGKWLSAINLSRHTVVFESHAYTLQKLLRDGITHGELDRMGITSRDDRRALMTSLDILRTKAKARGLGDHGTKIFTHSRSDTPGGGSPSPSPGLLCPPSTSTSRQRSRSLDGASAPPSWTPQLTHQGKLYYVNQATGESRWDKPDSRIRSQAPSSSAPGPSSTSTGEGCVSHLVEAATSKTTHIIRVSLDAARLLVPGGKSFAVLAIHDKSRKSRALAKTAQKTHGTICKWNERFTFNCSGHKNQELRIHVMEGGEKPRALGKLVLPLTAKLPIEYPSIKSGLWIPLVKTAKECKPEIHLSVVRSPISAGGGGGGGVGTTRRNRVPSLSVAPCLGKNKLSKEDKARQRATVRANLTSQRSERSPTRDGAGVAAAPCLGKNKLSKEDRRKQQATVRANLRAQKRSQTRRSKSPRGGGAAARKSPTRGTRTNKSGGAIKSRKANPFTNSAPVVRSRRMSAEHATPIILGTGHAHHPSPAIGTMARTPVVHSACFSPLISQGELENALEHTFTPRDGRGTPVQGCYWYCSVNSMKPMGSAPGWLGIYQASVSYESSVNGVMKSGTETYVLGRSSTTGVVHVLQKTTSGYQQSRIAPDVHRRQRHVVERTFLHTT